MFKNLYSFLESDSELSEILADKSFNSISNFIEKLKDFAFYDDLKNELQKNGIDLEEKLSGQGIWSNSGIFT